MYKLVFQLLSLTAILPRGGTAAPTAVAALLAFKAALDNGEAVLGDWVVGTDPCGWSGLSCKQGNVTSMSLSRRGLQGTLPTGRWLPSSLEVLDLWGNAIRGPIPPGLALPGSLTSLNLGSNELSGSLPAELALPGGLRSLGLHFNRLAGEIPSQLQLPATLQELEFARNGFSGSLPFDLPLPPGLLRVTLDNNRFSGSISSFWRLPGNLTWLDLSSNLLTGPIPADWDRVLPQSLNTQERFTGLGLHNNSLSGPLPAWPAFPMASMFVLPGNQLLCGPVPSEPLYFIYEFNFQTLDIRKPLGLLPACPALSPPPLIPAPPSPGQEDSGISVAVRVVVGAVLGAVGGIVVLGLLGWWVWMRRRRIGASKQKDSGVDSEKGISNTTDAKPGGLEDHEETSSSRMGKDVAAGHQAGLEDLQELVVPLQRVWLEQKIPTSPFAELADLENASNAASHWAAAGLHQPGGCIEQANLMANDPLLALITSNFAQSTTSNPAASPTAAAAAAPSGSGSTSAVAPVDAVGSLDPLSEPRPGLKPQGSKKLEVDVTAWVIPFQDLILHRMCGFGSFGRVYMAEWKGTTCVAVKLLLDHSSPGLLLPPAHPLLQSLYQEASMMAALRHPNVLGFYGLCLQPPCLISEFCPRGSVFDTLREARARPALARELGWPRRLRMALDGARGMHHLHSYDPPIMHRDLKSANLLIGPQWVVKVADFNLSRILGEGSLAGSSLGSVANPRFLAPEVLRGEAYTFASDVYAFAVVLWELLTFQPPWGDTPNLWQVSKGVMEGERPPIPELDQLPGREEEFSGVGSYIALMRRCWAQDPADRPTFAQIVQELRQLLRLAALKKESCDGVASSARSSSDQSSAKGSAPGLSHLGCPPQAQGDKQ